MSPTAVLSHCEPLRRFLPLYRILLPSCISLSLYNPSRLVTRVLSTSCGVEGGSDLQIDALGVQKMGLCYLQDGFGPALVILASMKLYNRAHAPMI